MMPPLRIGLVGAAQITPKARSEPVTKLSNDELIAAGDVDVELLAEAWPRLD